MKFEIFTDKSGEFRFRLINSNGKVALKSESYIAKSSATNGIESIKKNAADEKKYKFNNAEETSFNLVAGNGQVIGTSPKFADKSTTKSMMSKIMHSAAKADVIDLSNA